MHFSNSTFLIFAISISSLPFAHSLRNNLRERRLQGNSQGNGRGDTNGRKVGQTSSDECTVLVAQLLAIEDETIVETVVGKRICISFHTCNHFLMHILSADTYLSLFFFIST